MKLRINFYNFFPQNEPIATCSNPIENVSSMYRMWEYQEAIKGCVRLCIPSGVSMDSAVRTGGTAMLTCDGWISGHSSALTFDVWIPPPATISKTITSCYRFTNNYKYIFFIINILGNISNVPKCVGISGSL